MNTWNFVNSQIPSLKNSMEGAWQLAKLCEGWPYIYGDRGSQCTIAHRQAVYNKDPSKKVYQNVRAKCQAIRASNPTGSCSGCKWYPGGKRVLGYDCRGFTYWVLLKIYGWELMGTGATSQWNNKDNWTAQGAIDTIPDDMLVCLFQQDAKDKSVMAHTGFGYKGETIECQSGVQYKKSRESKWTHWGLPKCISGDAPTPSPVDPDKKPTLRKGDTGTSVSLMQGLLIQRGYSCGSYGADGKFGNATLAALTAFQKDHGLTADGICGDNTWSALLKEEPTIYYMVIIPHLTLAKADSLLAQWPGAEKKEE